MKFEFSNEADARKLFDFLRDRGIEGGMCVQDEYWELVYEDNFEVLELVAQHYDGKAKQIESEAPPKGTYLTTGKYKIDLYTQAMNEAKFLRNEADIYRAMIPK